MFQEPSYTAKDSNLVSSFLFTREGFFRLKSIRISISTGSCWFLSKVHVRWHVVSLALVPKETTATKTCALLDFLIKDKSKIRFSF